MKMAGQTAFKKRKVWKLKTEEVKGLDRALDWSEELLIVQ